MTARLLQVSGVVVDLLYDVEAVPGPGEEAIVDGFSMEPGGGFNAMVAARRAGMEVCYGGAIGTGPFADIARRGLDAEGIPVLRGPDPERDQGVCTVMVDRRGERTFVFSEGAEGHATVEDIGGLDLSGFGWTLLSGYALHYAGSRPAVRDWLLGGRFRGGGAPSRLVFDPSPVVAALPGDALAAARGAATWISANAREAEAMTGIADPERAALALADGAPEDGGAVVRDGARGCVVAARGHAEAVPVPAVDPVDTNGAGDTHLGSFVARLADGDSPAAAARYANAAASLSTTRRGPATAPGREEVAAALEGWRGGD